jgi:hypothetical protein
VRLAVANNTIYPAANGDQLSPPFRAAPCLSPRPETSASLESETFHDGNGRLRCNPECTARRKAASVVANQGFSQRREDCI